MALVVSALNKNVGLTGAVTPVSLQTGERLGSPATAERPGRPTSWRPSASDVDVPLYTPALTVAFDGEHTFLGRVDVPGPSTLLTVTSRSPFWLQVVPVRLTGRPRPRPPAATPGDNKVQGVRVPAMVARATRPAHAKTAPAPTSAPWPTLALSKPPACPPTLYSKVDH